jgi:osmoprotectant transport system substrate-binding protein
MATKKEERTPMKSLREPRRLVAGLAALALIAAACGGDDDAAPVTDPQAADEAPADETVAPSDECTTALGPDMSVSSLSELDFSGLTVNVGSKDFVEQFVLSQLLIVGLEAGGADTIDNVNLGGTVVNRDALLSNEIDAYFEYNGTGWTVHLGRDDPSFDSAELTNGVCVNDLEENGIRWLGVSEFNNTYGFATANDSPAAGLDLQGMADYLAANPEASVCMETEYPNRPDGLILFEEATNFQIPTDQIEILETGVIYEETAQGNCTFGEIFTTDGRIPALELVVVEDPGVHIIYNVSLTIPDSVYQQAPEAWMSLADSILNPLDNDTMAELNRRVSADGEEPRAVAEDFLREQGLIG